MNDREFIEGALVAFRSLYQTTTDAQIKRHCLELIEEAEGRRNALPLNPQRIVFDGRQIGSWLIGPADTPQRHTSSLVGLSVAWLAIAYGAVRIDAFAAPDSRYGKNVMSTAIRVTAANWIEKTAGCRALANLLRGIKIEGNQAIYTRRPHDPIIVTGLCDSDVFGSLSASGAGYRSPIATAQAPHHEPTQQP